MKLNNLGLGRVPSSMYELQSTMGGIVGNGFGSMNMDELLKNIWSTAQEPSQSIFTGTTSSSCSAYSGFGLLPDNGVGFLQTLPRTLTQKTVDEVWKDVSKECGDLGEMTLEEFLFKAGVAKEDDDHDYTQFTSNDDSNSTTAAEFRIGFQETDHQNISFTFNDAVPYGIPADAVQLELGSPSFGYLEQGLNGNLGQGLNGNLTQGLNGMPGKKNGSFEKVMDRRQRRMIKNRESAARSRARKQAYTVELETELAKLKEENQNLQMKHVEIMEIRKKQVLEMINKQPERKRRCLKRTHTGPL